jgi:tRNA1Val (adenine37-N6)-methyltransferase
MTVSEKSVRINENIELIQSTNGLTFGTDAYLLAAFARGGAKKTCADLGSGTGVIPLLCMANKRFKKIYAVEIQEKFACIIEKNASLNGFENRISAICADVRTVTAKDTDGEVDVVTANPPYMRADSGKRNEHDEKFIARHEVFGGIDDFCACADRLLKHGGKFYTVWRPDRLADLVCALRQHHLEIKKMVFVHATPESQPSVVLVQSTKGAASGNTVSRPLFLHASSEDAKNNVLSKDAAAIYANCSFDEFI